MYSRIIVKMTKRYLTLRRLRMKFCFLLLSVCAAFHLTHLFISTRAKRWSRDLLGRARRGEFSPLFLPSFRYQDCLVFYFEILLEFCIYHYFITCVKNLASLKFVLQGNLYE